MKAIGHGRVSTGKQADWGFARSAIGRIVDMVAGPRDKTARQPQFEQKVAELKTELEKLPANRQEQLRRELEEEGPGKAGK
jgi:hypothetical protein